MLLFYMEALTGTLETGLVRQTSRALDPQAMEETLIKAIMDWVTLNYSSATRIRPAPVLLYFWAEQKWHQIGE